MSFIVEDGTGLEDSNSYVSLAEFREYVADRYPQDYTDSALDSSIQKWLILSTEYADYTYSFHGDKADLDQSLEWPRVGSYNRTGKLYSSSDIPKYLKYAVIEFALIVEAYGTLDKNVVAEHGMKSRRLGPGQVTFDQSTLSEEPIYRKASKWISYIVQNSQLFVLRV